MANTITLSNVSISPTVFKPGDTVKATFTLANGSASTQNVTGVEVGLAKTMNDAVYYFASRIFVAKTIKPGASAKLSATFTIATNGEQLVDGYGDNFRNNAITYMVSNGTRAVTGVTFGITVLERTKAMVSEVFVASATISGATAIGIAYSPTIPNGLVIKRVDADGNEDDEGERISITTKLAVNGSPGSAFKCWLYYSQNETPLVSETGSHIDLSSNVSALLTGVTDNTALVSSLTCSNGDDWYFLLYYGDEYENATATASISEAFANVHLSGCDSGGVAFGKFSASTEGNPLFECEYPAVLDGGIASSDLFALHTRTHTLDLSANDSYQAISFFASEAMATTRYLPICVAGYSLNRTTVFLYRLYYNASDGKIYAGLKYTGSSTSNVSVTLTVYLLVMRRVKITDE